MENKITVSGLAAMIALTTGRPGELCERFLIEFFSIVSETLALGESVRIKGLGTFKVVEVDSRKSVDIATGADIEIPAHKRVIFVAAKEMASLVNAPFEAFEAVEVSDALPTDILMGEEIESMDEEDARATDKIEGDISEVVNPSNTEATTAAGPAASEETEGDDKQVNVISFSQQKDASSFSLEKPVEIEEAVPAINESENLNKAEDNSEIEEKSEAEDNSDTEEYTEDEEEYEDDDRDDQPSRFGRGFLLGFLSAVIIILAAGFIVYKTDLISGLSANVKNDVSKASANAEVGNKGAEAAGGSELVKATVVADSVISDSVHNGIDQSDLGDEDAVPTPCSDEPVYDTVSTTRYLTTMAQQYYGNYNLWPIIYKENQSILGDPDRIKPGTRVVVPPLSKYKIDPLNPEDVKRMKQEGAAIYEKFRKKKN